MKKLGGLASPATRWPSIFIGKVSRIQDLFGPGTGAVRDGIRDRRVSKTHCLISKNEGTPGYFSARFGVLDWVAVSSHVERARNCKCQNRRTQDGEAPSGTNANTDAELGR